MIFKVFLFISLSVLVSSDTLVDPSEAKIIVIYGVNLNQTCNLTDNNCIVGQPKYASAKTVLYIHGFNEGPLNESVQVIVAAYSNRQINLLVLDWSKFVTSTDSTFVTDYIAADLNLINLAPYVAAALIDLLNYSINLTRDTFSIVGHSLGGQLSAAIGRAFIQLTNGIKIKIIIGLDAAAPLFFPLPLPYVETLSKGDADCVENIHTDIPNYGSAAPTGDADFYPNCGLQGQPGCPSGIIVPFSADDLCSHQRSWRFFAESVNNTIEPRFWGYPAISCPVFLNLGVFVIPSLAALMGSACETGKIGPFYLKTNAQPLYAMGVDGY